MFPPPHQHLSLSFQSHIGEIKDVSQMKILGLTFDSTSTFVPNVTNLHTQIFKTFFLSRLLRARNGKLTQPILLKFSPTLFYQNFSMPVQHRLLYIPNELLPSTKSFDLQPSFRPNAIEPLQPTIFKP